MPDKRYIVCGDADYPVPREFRKKALRFRLYGKDDENKLTLGIRKMRTAPFADIHPRFLDLLNIATYVFAADRRTSRRHGSQATRFDNAWYRRLHFVIPVREPDFWSSAEVGNCLRETVGFLADDTYEFEFLPMTDRPDVREFLDVEEDGVIPAHPDQIVIFSEALDSLGGAIEESLVRKRRVFLINHRSATKWDTRYDELAGLLSRKAGRLSPHHIRVTVQKQEETDREHTRRSRSFLFVALGATIADMFRLRNVRFYENGVVSLNLPVCAQVVSGRATRTTHPKVIAGFRKLLTLVAGREFQVENPFLWKTKTDVVRDIVKAGCADLIRYSVSCAHTWRTSLYSHCGTCSQCVDRRFAVIAADAEKHDPLDSYAVDILTQGREKDIHVVDDRMAFATYIGRANRVLETPTAWDFLKTYPEVRRILNDLDDPTKTASLERAYDLYKSHAFDIRSAIKTLIARHSEALLDRTLPADAFLRMVFESALPVCVPVTPILEKLPENIFRRRGDGWELRFDGQKSFRLSSVDKGCEYIHELLNRPGVAVPVWEVAADDESDLLRASLGRVGDAKIDADGLKTYHDRLKEAKGELEKAEKNGDEAEGNRLTQEIEAIRREVNRVTHNGRIVEVNERKRKLSNSFSGAVKRAVKKIRETDAALAEHLNNSIQLGNHPVYQPAEPIRWATDRVVNQ